jgi:ABC-type phosphate/phosphonate transport system substrate-binding protein
LDVAGRVVRGAWSEIGASAERVNVVALLGEIPPDLVAARTSVPEELRDAIGRALLEMSTHAELGEAFESIFGGREFERGVSASYRALRDLVERASHAGLGGASDAYLSTAPPSLGRK